MDAIIAAIAGALGESDNIALLVSILFNVALGWAHVTWRREERTDRSAMLETFKEVTDALNGVRNALSAMIGKPLQ